MSEWNTHADKPKMQYLEFKIPRITKMKIAKTTLNQVYAL